MKYGLVVVYNDDGSVQRQYRITQKELAAVNASPNGVPPGLTVKEWTYPRGFRAVILNEDKTLRRTLNIGSEEAEAFYERRTKPKDITDEEWHSPMIDVILTKLNRSELLGKETH